MMPRPLLRFAFALLACLPALPVRAQTYMPRHYGVSEDVGFVKSIAFDRDGFLWLATPRGLLRFDGVRFVTVHDRPAHQVEAGPDGTLWLWADADLLRRRPGGDFTSVPVHDTLAASLAERQKGEVRLFPTSDGRLVTLDARSGLWLFDPATQQWTHLVAATEDEWISDFAEDGDGEAWVMTWRRLGRLRLPKDGASAHVTWLASFEKGRHVRPHPEGAWVTSDPGLFVYRRDGSIERVLDGRCWFTIPDVADDGTLALTIEGDRASGTALHLVAPDGTVRHRLSVENGLQSTALDAALFDDDGGLWLASEYGLDHFDDLDRLVGYELPSGVAHFRRHPWTGGLWVATYNGFFRFTDSGFERLGPDLRASYPRFAPDSSVFWMAMSGQPMRRRSYRWDGERVTRSSVTKQFRAVLPDGRRLYDRRGGAVGPVPHALAFEDGSTLVENGGVLLWFAAGPPPRRRTWVVLEGERLDVIEGDSLGSRASTTPPSVRSVLAHFDGLGVRQIHEDRFGRIWVATLRGLGVLHETGPDTWRVRMYGAATADVLPTETIISLDVAGGDRLWLGTDQGVFGFSLHAEEPWLRPRPLPGLNAALPTEVILTLREDGDGALWVVPVGPGTLFRYDWRAAALPSPAVRLTGLTVNGQPIALPDGPLRARADTTRLALDLAPRSFRHLADVRYEYRLRELDTTWATLEENPTARFDYLPAGRYTFEARAVRAGQPPGAVLAVPLHLVPPFYRADWFLALCALVLVGAVAAGAWRHSRQTRRRATELEAVVAERTADLQAEKAKTEAQAERLLELDEAKSRFFANVSHELRTPLTLLLGPIRDALSGPDGVPRRQLPIMHRSAERLLTLVDELLDLARLDAGRLRLRVDQHDLVALTRRIVLAFASRAEREDLALTFETALDTESDTERDTDEERLDVWVDAERIERVVSNLLTNAFKFTPSGGRVRVTLAKDEGADDGSDEGTAVLTVRDTGEGIPEDLLPHVFERFRQGDDASTRRYEGAGIGLALVRELVELHGGEVTVESEAGFGSAFTVRLPLGREHFDAEHFDAEHFDVDALDAARVDERPAASPSPVVEDAVAQTTDGSAETSEEDETHGAAVRTDATVLVVEDHDDMRAYLVDLLAPHYHVEEAKDGQAGLEAARRLAAEGRAPDLVISDVMMPGMDGYALCHTLKADPDLGHVPVVLLTARADEESRLEGLGEGADDYLAKPFSAQELLTRAENLIEVRRRLRARFSGQVVIKPTDVVVEREEADWLGEVKAICEGRLSDPNFGVDWLADELRISARTLRRRMKAASGLTPSAFLRTLRLERAAELLEAGAGSVAEVAAAVGYAEAESFSRAFQQGFGVAPSTYAEREA